jgi:hypothetical protein
LGFSLLFSNDKIEVIVYIGSDVFDSSIFAEVIGRRNGVDSVIGVFVESDMVVFEDAELFLVFSSDTVIIGSDIEELFLSFDVEKVSL